MISKIPDISPILRRWTETVISNHTSVVERACKEIFGIKPYIDLDLPTKLDIRNSISFSSRLWLDSLLSGKLPSDDALEIFREHGRRRVYQNISLEALLHAFRLASRELWCSYIEVDEKSDDLRDELLFLISPNLMKFFDAMSQIISQTYLEEQFEQAHWRQSLRHQLHSIILNSPEDADGFSKATSALRINGTTPRIALAIDVNSIDSNSPTFRNEIERIVAAIARCVKLPVDEIFDIWFHGRLFVWIPILLGDLTGTSDRQVGKQIAFVADSVSEVSAIGVGLPGEGASGWSMSADEASRALSFGRGRDDQARVRLYSAIALEEGIRGSRRVLNYLVSLLEQLANEPYLLETLQTYFDQLQRRKATASVLGIHPNTLNYRLERIENILGARLDDTGWISKLDMAIKLRGTRK
ncbi:PucR family transcriptional regulator [Burkholderia stagnalis]|uniref:PucR family transcriptional regulator n=1 Tax=Burkholderia stagnalis TaxID=1503054 RepID=A0A106NQP8_9BURK|nr:helix-turn-helix domain-containing protein [Burkholderia stagnalis]KVZ09423.1 PucR family transcriptional regulator [Burkholderia stagnalis]KWA47347.1 PucR family transcriptional regulator [Burkholderia stagnalis]KWA50212.1 PucR family transcriptional regulator [Burkholderia stagnalis]KWA65335.1 PucR family transcriptional regulator [Burkholderia stagnalis]KWC91004.1 PucR family transcriptional regulator [Burkholderia stagnalis]